MNKLKLITITITIASCAMLLVACASYPPEAQPIAAKALQERLAGKAFVGSTRNGMGWEMRYGTDDRMSMDVSGSYAGSDKGRWRTEDSRLCIDYEGAFPSGCSEIRADAKHLYLKRERNGEIVKLTTKP